MFIDRNDILNLYVMANVELRDAAVPPSGPVPRDADTARIRSVILWCNRFGVPLWRGAITRHQRG
jgi:hypothetical protein